MKGVLLFAFNNEFVNYYDMAVACAKRVKQFLNLPVTIVTDSKSNTNNDIFDQTILIDVEKDNIRGKKPWYNKGRYRAYELTPYDETLVIDTDYMVNSKQLLKVFEYYDDFMCHKNISVPFATRHPELMGSHTYETLWATVMCFKKTKKVEQIFQCMKMIQENYNHYVNLYKILGTMYRNDYALTIACRLVNGHYEDKNMIIPWPLVHIPIEYKVKKVNDTTFNLYKKNDNRFEYITVKDFDFHCLDKKTFMDIL